MNKTIVALIGSRAGERSGTRRLAQRLIDLARERSSFDAEILTADMWHIAPCKSCSACFKQGRCANDARDGMAALREKMLGADVLIFGSPVFAANVSGDMKTLVDRSSVWLHTMPLIGRGAVALSTTCNNHISAATDYLGMVLQQMGASLLGCATACTAAQPLLGDEVSMRALLAPIADLMCAVLEGHTPPPSEMTEQNFNYFGRRYRVMRPMMQDYPKLFGEALEWEKSGYFDCPDIQTAIDRRARRICNDALR